LKVGVGAFTDERGKGSRLDENTTQHTRHLYRGGNANEKGIHIVFRAAAAIIMAFVTTPGANSRFGLSMLWVSHLWDFPVLL
jgi:hypothetical protein